MHLKTALQSEKLNLIQEQNKLIPIIQKLPEGHIRFYKNGKTWKWRRVINEGSRSHQISDIRKTDIELARSLSLKHYLEERLIKINKQLSMINQFVKEYPALPRYPDLLPIQNEDYCNLLSPFFVDHTKPKEEWLSESYEQSKEHPEKLSVPTKAGIMVRSKSEAIIANELYDNHIPFRYEMAHEFGDVKIYPDFTIYHPQEQGTLILWEHFGLMDKSTYAQNARIKLGTYLDANYIPGNNLIVTYESREKPLDINYVMLLISYHFL